MERKKVNYYMVVKTGLHIGGQAEYEIAAIDNVVVKDPYGFPYVPGSSLKGKVRSLLESYGGEGNRYFSNLDDEVNEPKNEKDPRICKCGKCAVCTVFGFTNKDENGLSKVIFRDIFISEEAPNENYRYRTKESQPSDFLEVKFENTIDRKTAKAGNPRQTERVVPGTLFDVRIILTEDKNFEGKWHDNVDKVYQKLENRFKVEGANDYLKLVLIGLSLLEEDYLGGSGTRGYGEVEFIKK